MTKPSLYGYTKMPNWLFARLPELSPAGMRVVLVILAESVGWGTEAVVLSKAEIMRLSGLARSSVRDGIKDALQQQVIKRVPYQQGFAYRLKHSADTAPFPWHSVRHSIRWDTSSPDAQPPENQAGINRNSGDDLARNSDPQQGEFQPTCRL